jgi:hypothetical protein
MMIDDCISGNALAGGANIRSSKAKIYTEPERNLKRASDLTPCPLKFLSQTKSPNSKPKTNL